MHVRMYVYVCMYAELTLPIRTTLCICVHVCSVCVRACAGACMYVIMQYIVRSCIQHQCVGELEVK